MVMPARTASCSLRHRQAAVVDAVARDIDNSTCTPISALRKQRYTEVNRAADRGATAEELARRLSDGCCERLRRSLVVDPMPGTDTIPSSPIR